MRNIKLTLQYVGTCFHGWQEQGRGERTVQAVLGEAVRQVTGRRARVLGAGRTDAGVHALGQVACIRTASELPAGTLQRALNAVLPEDVRVTDVREVGEDFHPQYDARGKRYVYLIANMADVPPFVAPYVWRVPRRLRLAAMREAAGHLEGRHDFRAFMGAGSGVRGTERELREVRVRGSRGVSFLGLRVEGRFVRVEVEGDGFLRHMVRNIVGTLVDVGMGRCGASDVAEVLSSRDRRRAGPTAPACGLFLEEMDYGGGAA